MVAVQLLTVLLLRPFLWQSCFKKVIAPSRCMESRHLPENKTFRSQEAAKFQTFHLNIYFSEIQGCCVVFILILFHYVFALIFMTLSTGPTNPL